MGEIAPEEQFLPLSTIFCYLMLDFFVKTGIRCSLRDKRLFELTEVEITRVDCIHFNGLFHEIDRHAKSAFQPGSGFHELTFVFVIHKKSYKKMKR